MLARTPPPPPGLFKRVLSALSPQPPAARPYSEMGVSGTSVFGGYVQMREKSSKWTGSQRYITISDMAVNASIVAAGIQLFTNLVARPGWTINPVDESSEAKQAAEFVDEVLNSMSQPWSRIVRRATMFRFYGFGVQEWTAKRRKDGRVGLASIEPRPQHSIERWAVEDNGDVKGVFQVHPMTGQELGIPRSKILYLVDDSLSDSPEGVGIFRHLAEPWERLQTYYALEARAFERDLRGTPVGRIPYAQIREAVKQGEITEAQASALVSTVENFVKLQVKQSDTAITLDSIPYYSQAADGAKVAGIPQWGLELLQGGAAGIAEVAAAITRTQTEMARVLAAEHLMMGESSGNRALGEDKSRNLYLVANAVLGDIAAGVDSDIIPVICKLNGIAEELWPKCEPEDVAFKSAESVASTLAKMAQAGAVLAPDDPVIDDVRSLMGVSASVPASPEMMGLPTGGAQEGAQGEVEKNFNPDQPRDDFGRWSSSGASGGSPSGDVVGGGSTARALFLRNHRPELSIEQVLSDVDPHHRDLMDAARAGIAAGTSTRTQYLQEDGTYTPEREALHERILARTFSPEVVARATPSKGQRPEMVLTGGRPGSGKTSALKVGDIDVSNHVYISADVIQEYLPGYDGSRAGLFNPEAQDIADKAEAFARRLGVNYVFDATMRTKSSAVSRVDRAIKAGYDVSGYFVHTAPHVSAKRTIERFIRSGRFVPPEVSFNSLSNEDTFDSVSHKMKKWAIFDNNGDAPKLVARSK